MDRRKYIGGSDIGRIAGLSRWGGKFSVFLEKTAGLPQRLRTKEMSWGQRLEAPICEIYAEETGLCPKSCGYISGAEATWFGGTPDRLVGSDTVLEIKTCAAWMEKEFGEPGTDQIPDEYLAQTTWYMRLTSRPKADLAVLIGGNDFRIYKVYYDREFSDMLFGLAEEFWKHFVEPCVAPEIDCSKDALSWLRSKWRTYSKDFRNATKDENATARKLVEIDLRISTLLEQQRKLENSICNSIGSNAGINFDFGRVSWKKDSIGRVSWKSVAERMGATDSVIDSCRSEPQRIFRASWRHARHGHGLTERSYNNSDTPSAATTKSAADSSDI